MDSNLTFYGQLHSNASIYPDKIAIIYKKKQVKWLDLYNLVNILACHFYDSGLIDGDKVVLSS